MNPLRFVWFGWVKRGIWSLWILSELPGLREFSVVIRSIPIAAPLPDVARHVVKPIAVRGKLRYWRDSSKTVVARIFHREFALPGISHPFTVRPKVVSPSVRLIRKSAAFGILE